MRKKELAALLLGNRALGHLMHDASLHRHGLRILAYHRILDDDPRTFPFDEGVISATSQLFRGQMEFVRKHFQVLSFADIWQYQREGRRLPEHSLAITFDDGYRDNYTHAFPVLKDLGLTATIFLSTGHIGQARLFWWDTIAYCVKHTARPDVLFPQISPQPMPLKNPRERGQAIRHMLSWIKQVPEQEKSRFLHGLAEKLEVTVPASLAEGMHLSWEEVRQMAEGGIEFGSHTVSHPILTQVGSARLTRELRDSKEMLERQLKQKVLCFSYPNGCLDWTGGRIKREVQRCGFQYATAYRQDIAQEANWDPFALPRIHVELDHSLELFRTKVLGWRWVLRDT